MLGPQVKAVIRNVQCPVYSKIIKEKTGDLKFRSEWTGFRFTQGPVSSGFTVLQSERNFFLEKGLLSYMFQALIGELVV